jgi:1-acyl-sn-glycerol-3-phosphate acyltransferase
MLGWHPVLVLTRYLNASLHRRALDIGIGILMCDLRLVGWKVELSGFEKLPEHGPVAFLSNHQHLFDIPLLMWYLRRYYPKFVAKRELGRGFPCASLILRTGGSALIDRGNAAQSLREIGRLGELIERERYAACIFPEGTRARQGEMRKFKSAGAARLIESAPSAAIVPVTIDGTWKLSRYNFLPVPWGETVRLVVGEPIRNQEDREQIIQLAEERVRAGLNSGSTENFGRGTGVND